MVVGIGVTHSVHSLFIWSSLLNLVERGPRNMRALFLLISTTLIYEVFSSEKTAVLILARGGSKGVRLKNLQLIGGLSLLARAIQTVKLAGIHDVTVSTDHPLIALEALKYGATILHRSFMTATDWAPSIWGASEFLSKRPDVEILVLIQATSPFIQPLQLREALRSIKYPKPFDCIFSVTRSFKFRWRESNGVIYPINFDITNRPRRQDWTGEILETGAFYISRRSLIESGYFQNHNCTVLEVPAANNLEVDSYRDLQVANALLSSNLV